MCRRAIDVGSTCVESKGHAYARAAKVRSVPDYHGGLGRGQWALARRITRLISSDDGIELVGVAADYPELIELVTNHEPDVVVTDIRMPPTGTRRTRFGGSSITHSSSAFLSTTTTTWMANSRHRSTYYSVTSCIARLPSEHRTIYETRSKRLSSRQSNSAPERAESGLELKANQSRKRWRPLEVAGFKYEALVALTGLEPWTPAMKTRQCLNGGSRI